MSAYTAIVVYDACSRTDGSMYETALVIVGSLAGMAIGIALMMAISNIADRFR